MNKILFVANVAKEHILKFHIPSIKKFKDEGWTVDVACAGDEAIPFCDHQYHTSWKRNPFSLATIKGIKELREIINKNGYDIIYCHTPVGGAVARMASVSARKKGTRVVYFSHGFHFYKGAPLVNWVVYYPMEKLFARYTDVIITINQEDYSNAKKKLKCKEVYLLDGMGVDICSFRNVDKKTERSRLRKELNIPDDAWVMIYLAELIPNKNQKMLLEALKEVLVEYPFTYLVLAGIDHNNGKTQKYARDIGVEKNVRFLGWRSDKEALYALADICTASSIREGFGLNLVEALASGIPVVATRNRGHETIISNGRNGFLVEVGQSKTMAELIIHTLKEQPIKESSFKELEKYSEEIICERIIEYVSLQKEK